jgi:glycosyltransferase involved in cell wall biosynthesis
MARILILIGGHLCTAPRPQKEATALAAAGHEVRVVGLWFDEALAQRDRALLAHQTWTFDPVLDFRPGQASRLGVRLQAKTARKLYQWVGLHHPALLGYGAPRLLQVAQAHRADLTIVHSEAGLWVGQQLLKQGYAVGVDFEDWFSQDLLPTAHHQRPIRWIAELEAFLLQHCCYRLTTSQAMAAAMANHYQVTPPTVVYNVFPKSAPPSENSSSATCPTQTSAPSPEKSPENPPARRTGEAVRLHWFSQTIGPGRGLELLFAALSRLTVSVEVHLRGHCSPKNQSWLAQHIPLGWANQVHIHPTVSNDELPAHIAENDIGLALEQTSPPSRDLTITNKLFQYLQAGLAVIATDTAGQREVFQQFPAIGQVVEAQDATALAAAIETLVCHPAQLKAAKAAARQAAETQLCWELEGQTLVAAAEMALSEVLDGGPCPPYRSPLVQVQFSGPSPWQPSP